MCINKNKLANRTFEKIPFMGLLSNITLGAVSVNNTGTAHISEYLNSITVAFSRAVVPLIQVSAIMISGIAVSLKPVNLTRITSTINTPVKQNLNFLAVRLQNCTNGTKNTFGALALIPIGLTATGIFGIFCGCIVLALLAFRNWFMQYFRIPFRFNAQLEPLRERLLENATGVQRGQESALMAALVSCWRRILLTTSRLRRQVNFGQFKRVIAQVAYSNNCQTRLARWRRLLYINRRNWRVLRECWKHLVSKLIWYKQVKQNWRFTTQYRNLIARNNWRALVSDLTPEIYSRHSRTFIITQNVRRAIRTQHWAELFERHMEVAPPRLNVNRTAHAVYVMFCRRFLTRETLRSLSLVGPDIRTYLWRPHQIAALERYTRDNIEIRRPENRPPPRPPRYFGPAPSRMRAHQTGNFYNLGTELRIQQALANYEQNRAQERDRARRNYSTILFRRLICKFMRNQAAITRFSLLATKLIKSVRNQRRLESRAPIA